MLEILRATMPTANSMQRSIDGMSVPHKTGATTPCDGVRAVRLQSRVVAMRFHEQNADIRWVVDNEAQVAAGEDRRAGGRGVALADERAE